MPGFICQKCGFNNPPGMRFCGNCGTRLPIATEILEPESEGIPSRSGDVGVMMGADLLERFKRAGLEAAGQRRNVTILFVDLAGFTQFSHHANVEETYQLVQKFVQLMAQDVYKYDGMVDKFLGDGLMAIFGAPIAHENNVELAVRAALDMRADITRLAQEVKPGLLPALNLHIGLHTGTVVVGSLGSNLMMNYTAIGDTVNMAYRLMEAAPAGFIWGSYEVYQRTRSIVDYAAKATLQLKGLDEPIHAFAVLQMKPKPGSVRGIEGMHGPMIGREPEIKWLRHAQEELITRGYGRFIFVQGEAGVGKSRLIGDFSANLAQAGVRCLTAHSLSYRRSVSYWIFKDLLFNLLNLPESAPVDQIRQQLENASSLYFRERAKETLPYLEYLLALPARNEEAAARLRLLDAAQLRQQILLTVRDLIVAEARRIPLVLIFEDIHWADEASLDLLKFLIESAREEPLLLLAAARPNLESTLQKLIQHADRALSERFLLIMLAPLSLRQSAQLLEGLLGDSGVPEEVKAKILARADGNPFFLEETVRMLVDTNVIQAESDGWRATTAEDIRNLGVPDSIEGLVLSRFDRLPETHRRLLQKACVIGRDFSSRVLAELLENPDPGELEAVLKDLIQRSFLETLTSRSENDYRFTHTLVCEAIYSTLLTPDRAGLHGQIAAIIEEQHAGRLEDQVELLARHYSSSDRLERAIHYLILAGQRSARGYANIQARQHFESALALLSSVQPSRQQLLDIHTGLGDVLNRTGNYGAAREEYLTALDSLCKPGSGSTQEDWITRARIQRSMAASWERQGDYTQALNSLSTAQAALEEIPDTSPEERAWVLNDAGWIYFRRGSLEEAEKILKAALRLVEDSPHYDLVASIYNRLGGVAYQKDQLEQASGYVRKSLFLRQEIGDVNAVARSYNNLGLLRWKRGDWDSALDDFNRSLKLHANLGDVEGIIELNSNLGLLHLDRGDFPEARRHLDSAMLSARKIGHQFHIGLLQLHFSRLYVSLESWEKALDCVREGLNTFKELGVSEYLVDLNTFAGLAYLGLGDLNQAERCGYEALNLFEKLETKPSADAEDRGRAIRLLAQVAIGRQEPVEALELLRECTRIFKAVGNQMEQGRTTLIQAEVTYRAGGHAEARQLVNEARLVFRQLGARTELKKVESLALEMV